MKNILIITASIGNGHITASKGLKEKHEQKGSIVNIVDFGKETLFGRGMRYTYSVLGKYKPSVIEYIFDFTNTSSPSKFDVFLYTLAFSSFLRKNLKKYSPDTIIITFPLITPVLRKYFDGKIIIQVTDYWEPHLSWIWGDFNDIHVLDDESKIYLSHYTDSEKIHIKPFPIPNIFGNENQNNSQNKINKINKIDKKIISLFFHFALLGNEIDVIKKILIKYPDHNINILSGKNYTYFLNIPDIQKAVQNNKITLMPWLEDINTVYDQSIIVGGKCGGAFISEVMKRELPLIITGVFSGQEQGNDKYLQKYYAGKIINL